MQIIYFIADKSDSEVTLDFVQSIGLSYAFDKRPASRGVMGNGVDGNRGVVIGRSAEGLGYHPSNQYWEPMAGQPGVWIGIDTKSKPTPRELVRREWLNPEFDSEYSSGAGLLCIDSHSLVTDDYTWPIPVARGWSTKTGSISWSKTLPQSLKYGIDENGNKAFLPGETIKKFLRLEEIAEMIWDEWQKNCIPDNNLQLVSEVLGIPYFLGPQEITMMELINMQPISVANLLWLVVDDPGFRIMSQKKIADEVSSVSSGSEV